MPEVCADNFISKLAALLGEEPLREKWIVAPSNRIGYQWLDRVALSDVPVLNVRVKTLRAIAIDIAAALMEKRDLQYLNSEGGKFIVAGLLWRSMDEEGSYFGDLRKSWKIVQAIHRALTDIRMAGVSSAELDTASFEEKKKGRELSVMLKDYEKSLESTSFVDYAGALGMAIDALETSPRCIPENLLIVMPGDIKNDLRGQEAMLADQLLKHCGVIIDSRERPDAPKAGFIDSELLRFVLEPSRAPEPSGDGTATFFRAVGEINEVREVFRRCACEGIPLDDVELLYTDKDTYVPLIFEEAITLSDGDITAMPVAFYDGIPVMYSRPGRALFAFLRWIFEGYPQEAAARLIQEGLMDFGDENPAYSRLAAMLRTLPIGEQRERYISVISAKIEFLKRSEAPEPELADWFLLLDALEKLTSAAKSFEKTGSKRLEASLEFLSRIPRRASKLDEYSHSMLKKSINDLIETGSAQENFEEIDFAEWLLELLSTASVEGKGPRPGCLYAAPLHAGGHTGRGYIFIVGLDDTRFPGQGRQDPVLLDSERQAISPELKYSGVRPTEKMEEFARVVSRAVGEITLGYCCRKLGDDRLIFPSPAVLAAYRVISGNWEGNLEDFERWIGEPVSFAPLTIEECLNSTDLWLNLVCRGPVLSEPEKLAASVYVHLGRGYVARDARAGDRFTEYDGYVPEAGKECGFPGEEKEPVSPTRLETLGRCPMEYFFKYILGIEVPEVYEHDATRWLDHAETGSLLHEVFHEFMKLLIDERRAPDFDRDYPRLLNVLGLWVQKYKEKKPPERMDIFEREVINLEFACLIFLKEEEAFSDRSVPAWCEIAIGLPSDGEGTELDTGETIEVKLPGGRSIYVRGRIDRIDRLAGDKGAYAVFDYKTGSDSKFKEVDPNRKGRLIQNSLYMELADRRLKSIDPSARVELFGYFFPNDRAHGARYEWSRDELAGGLKYVELLCQMLERGCFTLSDEKVDMEYSDYLAAFGDAEIAAENAKRKMANDDNTAMDPFRKLRE